MDGTSASIVTSPQTFEQTLQNQEAETGLIDNTCQTSSLRRQRTSGLQQQQQQNLAKSNETHPGISGTSNNNKQLIEQQQANNIQLLLMQQTQLPHFNYNPLYTGVQHQNNNNNNNNGAGGGGSGSQATDDKNTDGLNTAHMSQADDLLNGDEDEDVLNDIYHYSDSSATTTAESNCNKTQQQDFAGGRQQVDTANATHYCNSYPIHHNPNPNHHQLQQQTTSTNSKQTLRPSGGANLVGVRGQSVYSDTLSSLSLASAGVQRNARAIKLAREPDQQQQQRTKRQSSTNSFLTFDQNQQPNNSFQSQQFTLAVGTNTSGSVLQHHQLDLSEECNGLFVEYQTNRNSLGTLEELHSLNVTNCDSETLEEQINMLSQEDCFATSDDLQDYAIGGTNDHFLNMLFNGNGNSSNGSAQIVGGSHLDAISVGQLGQQVNVIPSSQMELVGGCSLVADKQQAHVCITATEPPVQTVVQANQRKVTTTNKNLSQQRTSTYSICEPDVPTRANKISNGVKKSTASPARGTATTITPAKMATTNSMKRLMPKKSGSAQAGGNKQSKSLVSHGSQSNNSWMTSPSSASSTSVSSAMSPGSGSQFEFEAPYRQQLDNLRKKLKMDVPLAKHQQCEIPAPNSRAQLLAKEAPKSICTTQFAAQT